MAQRREYEVAILVSLDTDLRPALEVVTGLRRAWGKPRAEVAAFTVEGKRCRRLSISGGQQVFCHWISQADYSKMQDLTDYSAP